MQRTTIQIFTTGGTIDKVYFDRSSEYAVGCPQIVDVLERSHVVFDYEVETLFRKDSLDLIDEDRDLIHDKVQSCRHLRILITHGTDSMVQTAARLRDLQDKVIVLTGSLEPARFTDSSAIFNIGCAVAGVQALPAGVYIAMNGRLFEGHKVRKNRKLWRFEDTD